MSKTVKKLDHIINWGDHLQIKSTMMGLSDTGKYVLASDYACLEQECERLRAALQKFADLGIKSGNSKWPELDDALACCAEALSAKP